MEHTKFCMLHTFLLLYFFMYKFIFIILKYIQKLGFCKGLQIFYFLKWSSQNYFYLSFLKKNIFFRPKSEDRYTFFEVFLKECYQVKTLLQSDKVQNIIDAGANAGFASLYFRSQFPKATIIAIEPESKNFEILVKNTQDDTRIIAQKTALWNESTFLKVKTSDSNRNFSVVKATENEQDAFIASSIQDIMKQNQWKCIDVLKIDIEGAEKEVFSKNYEEWLPLTKCIVMEIHDDMKKGCSKAVFSAVTQYNFSTYINEGNFIFINENFK